MTSLPEKMTMPKKTTGDVGLLNGHNCCNEERQVCSPLLMQSRDQERTQAQTSGDTGGHVEGVWKDHGFDQLLNFEKESELRNRTITCLWSAGIRVNNISLPPWTESKVNSW